MIIKSIKLNNFRQFKDEHLIKFSTDKEKNVSVILGSNTCGKTTIVGAFIWCLYGENTLKEPKTLLNNIAANSLTGYSTKDVSVEVVLTHENREFIILRTQRFQKTSMGDAVRGNSPELKVSYVDENGETTAVSPYECQNVIESILPAALADYFFFDGERIKKINTKGNVVNAVRGLMGLDVYSAGIDHLNPNRANSVIGVLKKELDVGKDYESTKRQMLIQQYKEDLEKFQNHAPELQAEIDHYKYKLEDLSRTIKANEDVREKQDKKEKLEKDENFLNKLIISSEERFLSEFNSNSSRFFALPLIKKSLDILNSAKEEGVGIPNMHSASIDFILKRGKCICGCDLTKNQGAVECIQHEQSLLPPHHIGTSVRMFKNDMQNAMSVSNIFGDRVKTAYNDWLSSQSQLEDKRRELKEISEQIKGYKDIRKIEEDYQNAEIQYKRNKDALQNNHDTIIRLKTQIEENEKEIKKFAVTNDKNKKIMKYCDYAEAVYDWFKFFYDKQEKSVKEELLESINNNFSQMYHGSRTIMMDNNYRISPVLTGTTTDLAKSEGLETVTNFSFIMGLVELARKRANSADDSDVDNQKVTEPYPIVMDAPFSNTDTKHIENITARLPKVAEQVIIFVMDKDWDIAKKELEKNLGSKYIIEKVDNKDDHSILRREI